MALAVIVIPVVVRTTEDMLRLVPDTLREAAASGRCKITALVDVDRRQLDKCSGEVAKWGRDQPKLYEDYREMLDKEKM